MNDFSEKGADRRFQVSCLVYYLPDQAFQRQVQISFSVDQFFFVFFLQDTHYIYQRQLFVIILIFYKIKKIIGLTNNKRRQEFSIKFQKD